MKIRSIINNLRRIRRLRIRLHYAWYIAFVLITAVVVTQFPQTYPLWYRIMLGMAASFLFLVSISIREFAIIFTAINWGVPVRNVTLTVFGGISPMPKESNLPIIELTLGLVGLLSGLMIAGMLYLVHLALVGTGSIILPTLIHWLAFINLMLAFFHFIPGLPLDGGKVLRALLWWRIGNYDRATYITSWTGQSFGLLFFVGGILMLILTRQWSVGLLLAPAGWALQSAAARSRRYVVLRKALQNVTARDIMTKEWFLITRELSLSQLIQNYILITGRRYFIVADGPKLLGVVTMRNIKSIPKKHWGITSIGEIMTPASELRVAHPEEPAASLFEQMEELKISYIPVLEEDKMIGIVAQDSLISLVRTRAELGYNHH